MRKPERPLDKFPPTDTELSIIAIVRAFELDQETAIARLATPCLWDDESGVGSASPNPARSRPAGG